MPDPVKAPAAPATPPSAPAPAAAPKSAVAAAVSAPAKPAVSKPAPQAKPSIKPPASSTRPRPTISAKKALGLEETPRKAMDAEIKKSAARTNLTTPTTAEYAEPVEPSAPPIVEPPEPAAPVEPPAEPAAPAAPAKIKVGGKEYTPEELEAELAKGKPAPAPAPAAPKAPEAPKPAAPTKEQIEKMESDFISTTAASLDAPLTEAEMDTILAGGKEAVSALTEIRKRDMAKAILVSRKGMAEKINPVLESIFASLKPLVEAQESLTRYNVGQQFVSKFPDAVPHVDTFRQVAEELIRLYPEATSKMSTDQFLDEVFRQGDIILTSDHKRWFPTGNGNWRQSAAPAPPAAPAAPAPGQPPAAPAAPASLPAPPRVVRAPAANAPVTGGSAPVGWGKSVAGSMRG